RGSFSSAGRGVESVPNPPLKDGQASTINGGSPTLSVMAGRTRQKQVIAGIALAVLGAACSTGLLGKLDPADVPAELPPELRQKFEIQDPSQVQPTPSAQPAGPKPEEKAQTPPASAPEKAGAPARRADPVAAKKSAAPAAAKK